MDIRENSDAFPFLYSSICHYSITPLLPFVSVLFLSSCFILQPSNIHLYGMDKEKFYSELFRREIHK